MNTQILYFIFMYLAVISTVKAQNFDYFKDNRDGHQYKYIKIGEQYWMAENLSYKSAKGSSIYNHKISAPDTIQNNEYYGRLYTFEAAQEACPNGWHLPTDDEWNQLIEFLGGKNIAGGKMKSLGTQQDKTGLWNAPNKDATNESGFSAVPGGYKEPEGYFLGKFIPGGYYTSIEHYGVYWSSTKANKLYAYSRTLTYQFGSVMRNSKDIKVELCVRCIRDSQE